MVRPEAAQRTRSNQTQPTSDAPTSAIQLNQSIDGALNSIRQQRRLLRRVRDGGYDIILARQQVMRLTELQRELQTRLEQAPDLDEASLASMQQSSNSVRSRLTQLEEHWNRPNPSLPEKKELKKRLQDIILQLQATLNDLEIELEAASRVHPSGTDQPKQLANLQRALEREQQQITIGDLGQSRKAVLLKQLHQLMLLVYRLRQLVGKPRLQRQLSELEGTALQIQDTVHDLDLEASNASELLESSLYLLERRLIQFEYDRRFGFAVFPVSWFINRYRDVALMKSIQGRILSGLGFSLALSGLTFFILTVPLTLISGYASRSQDGIRKELAEKQRVFTVEVNDFLQLEQEREALQAQIDNLNAQILSETAQTSAASFTPSASPSLNREAAAVSGTEATEAEAAPNPVEVPAPQTSSLLNSRTDLLVKQNNNNEKLQKQKTDIVQQLREIQALYAALSGDLSRVQEAKREAIATNPPTSNALSHSTRQILPSKPDHQTLTSLANFITDKGLLDHTRRILLAAFAGALGSMMSILIRLDQMEKEDVKNPFLLGALKPLIGAIFGIAVFAILSTRVIDILPSSFYLHERQIGEALGDTTVGTLPSELRGDPLGELDSQELYKIFLVAFLAGFSERLANDTLKSVGSTRSLG